MEEERIVLLSDDKKAVFVDLYRKPPQKLFFEEDESNYASVFADQEYEFRFENLNMDQVSSFEVFINDEKQDYSAKEDTYRFFDYRISRYCPFKNRFGFVELSVIVYYLDGEIEIWHSDFLSILVRRDQELEMINAMIDYVYKRQDELLVTGSVGSKTKGGIKPNRYIDLDTRVSLVHDILKAYKDSYGYFKANSRFKTDYIEIVDDTSKLQHITPKTLQYIVTHPGHLRDGRVSGGVHIGNRYYVPRKTLIQKSIYTYNIYENRIIVGFLGTMIEDINSMISSIKKLLRHRTEDNNNEYVPSAYLLFQRTEISLKKNLDRLNVLKSEYEVTRNLYLMALGVDDEIIKEMPKPSAIFMSVAQYNLIYKHINTWFEYGVYDLDQERFMMSFINGSTLYEVYALSKLLDAAEQLGYNLREQYRYSYRVETTSFYRNTMCNNTFEFESLDERITIYYQPVIFNSDYRIVNGINLYRNNTLAVNGYGSYYYSPDYLIKYERGDKELYLILDAKYSNRNYVREKQVSDLSFKYLISISPRGNASVNGLVILYGKAKDREKLESVYNKQLPEKEIMPKFKLAPISANMSMDAHRTCLKSILRDAFK